MNIDGVNVLTQQTEEVITSSSFSWTSISIILIIAAIAIFIGYIITIYFLIHNDKTGVAVCLIIPVACLLTFLTCGGIDAGIIETKQEITTYQVTIDEDVPFREIVSNYTFISQDGEIFTLQDKYN